MKSLAPYYQKRMAFIDLASGVAETMDIPDDSLAKCIGGAALAADFASMYPGAIIFATGPLVGSFAPASGLITATFPLQNGKTAHLALPLGHGAWLRQSGFDLMVITGSAAEPSVIRCAKGRPTLDSDASFSLQPDRNALRKSLLRQTVNGLSGLLLADTHFGSNDNFAPAAGSENGTLPGAPLLGAAMAAKNILAVSLDGGCLPPPVPVPLHGPLWQKATQISESPRDALLRELELSSGAPVTLPTSLAIKSAACYHCPSPCLAWVPTSPSRHLLAADHASFAAAVTFCGVNAGACMAACDARGTDILIAAPFLAGHEHNAIQDALNSLTLNTTVTTPTAQPLDEAQKFGLILGVCPRLIRRKALTTDDLALAVGSDIAERLQGAVALFSQETYI